MATKKMTVWELNELRGTTGNKNKMTESELDEYRKKGNDTNIPLKSNETSSQDSAQRRAIAEKMIGSRGYIVSPEISKSETTQKENTESKKVSQATAIVARAKRSNGLTTKAQREEAKEAQTVIKEVRKEEQKKNSGVSPVRALQSGLYLFDRALTGAGGAIEDVFKIVEAAPDYALSKVTGALGLSKVSDALKKNVEEILERETFAEKSRVDADEAYKPSSAMKYAGDLFEAGGNLALPILAEATSLGTSPWLDAKLAGYGVKFAGMNKATKKAAKAVNAVSKTKVGRIVANMWKPSSVVFRAGVTGSAASDAYRQTGDIDKAMRYGYFTGLAETLTEQIFGGFAGTDIGASLIDFKIDNKVLRKTVTTLTEALEEMMMTAAEPAIKKISNVDKNAQFPKLIEFAKSGASGILLSALMGVATAQFNQDEKEKAVKTINTVTDRINSVIADSDEQIIPLASNASMAQIKIRQQEIQNFAKNYAVAGFGEILEIGNAALGVNIEADVKKIPDEMQKKSVAVGDTFKDIKTGNTITVVERDAKNTVVQIDTGTKSEARTYKNSQADMLSVEERYKLIDNTDILTAVESDGHTPEMQKIIQDYKKSVDTEMLEFISKAKSDTKNNTLKYNLSNISDKLALEINNITGINIKGFKNTIKANSIRHIAGEHGINGITDESMADEEDIARMQYVIDNYDSVELLPEQSKEYRDKNQRPAPMIKISKRINGTYYVVEAVPDTKKRELAVVTAYKNKAVNQQTRNATSPHSDARNASADTAFIDNSISQNNTDVNNKYMQKSGENSELLSDSLGAVGLVRDGYAAMLDQNEATAMDKLAKICGVRIKLLPSVEGGEANGKYEDGTIYIALDSDKKILSVFAHEITHHFEDVSPKAYVEYKKAVINIVSTSENTTVDELIREKIEEYKEHGVVLEKDGAEAEIVADYTMELIKSPDKINELIDAASQLNNFGKRTVLERFISAVKDVIEKIKKALGADIPDAVGAEIKLTENAVNALERMITEAQLWQNSKKDINSNVRFSIKSDFITQYDMWVKKGRPNRQTLVIGTTSDALQSIGVKKQRITWDTNKINDSLKKHSYLNDSILKQIPQLIESPVIVMQSKNFDSRLTMFGEVYDGDGLPVMTVLELLPLKDKRGIILDEIKVVSTHSRKIKNPKSIAQTQALIDTSDILYVEPNKKRTDNWLTRTRLQLPFGVTNYGSIKNITYPEGNVNTYSMQKNEKVSESKTKYMFASEKSLTADKKALETAKDMEKNGEAYEDIFRKTGWFKGVHDNIWRYEIDDSGIKFYPEGKIAPDKFSYEKRMRELLDKKDKRTKAETNELLELYEKYESEMLVPKVNNTLPDFFEHDELFEAYPQLKDILFKLGKLPNDTSGKIVKNSITVKSDMPVEEQKTVSVHEIQHAIQLIENFMTKLLFSNAVEDAKKLPEYTKLNNISDRIEFVSNHIKSLGLTEEKYKFYDFMGELEANDAKHRANLTSEERRNIMPLLAKRGNGDNIFTEEILKKMSLDDILGVGIFLHQKMKEEYDNKKNQTNDEKKVSKTQYSLKKNSNDTDGDIENSGRKYGTQIKYSSKGIKLPKAEREKFISSVGTDYFSKNKTHEGLQYQSCVTDKSHILYLYEDGGFGQYNVVARIDYADEDIANTIMEGIKNGTTYRITDLVNRSVKILANRRSSYTVYNVSTKKRISARGDGIVSERQSESNSGRTDGSSGGIRRDSRGDGRVNEKNHKTQYSLKKSGDTDGYAEVGRLTKAEWSEFYRSLGELERGMWFPTTSEGEYIFETHDKLIFNNGNYSNPKINSVVVFEGLDSEEIEYGKEIAYYAAQRGEDSQECYEAIRDVLGYEYVTRANPYPDKTYQGGKNGQGKGRNSESTDNGSGENVKSSEDKKYSLKGTRNFAALIQKYGYLPKGENAARDVQVPKKISEDNVVSRFARTMLEAGITPDYAVSEFENRILDGTMTHEVITNENARDSALKTIKDRGFKGALNHWTELTYTNGKVGKEEFALGMELYNQCITNKDVHNAMKIAAELVSESTRAGQTLQAARMLKLMSPDGQLYYLEKSIQKMNNEFRRKIGKKYKDIVLDEALMEEFLNEKDEERRNAVYDKICQNIADQIPSTLRDKWNSWRYLAMLGNPRTHLRNIVGNAVFTPALRMKNYVGAVIEKTAKLDTAERTKTFKKTKAAVEFAKKDFAQMQKVLQGENAKYAITNDIEGKRTIFNTKWLEKVRTKNFEFLEKEDMWFLKMHYVDALARLITARKLDVKSIDQATLDKIRVLAVREAQAATYRDANDLADGLNYIQRKIETSNKKYIRPLGILTEGVMPFKKTPLNIAKQGVYYSPVGILSGTYKVLEKLYSGNAYSSADIIDDFAKGLTGTGLLLVGLFLARLGFLSGPEDENKKKKEFDKMVGEQSYALNTGESSYTIDWMTPMCLPLFVGVELNELTKNDFSFADVVDATSTLTEPLLELSVFSGINDVIESAQYSEQHPLVAVGTNMVTSYFTQALPTIGGQISRINDKNKREYYYSNKNSNIPKGIQRLIGQASSKIPFASYLFEPSVDEWGREEEYGGLAERIFENTLSPGYYSKKNYTEVDNELQALYERTGESSVLPVIQQTYYTKDKMEYYMSAKDYAEVKKLRGQKSFKLIEALINSSRYKKMSDSEKVKAIKKCYEQAGEQTKEEMFEKVKQYATR